MGYVEDTLGSGEKIEYIVSFHWLWTFFAYCFLLIGVGAGITLLVLLPREALGDYLDSLVLYTPSLICLFIALVIFFYMMIKNLLA